MTLKFDGWPWKTIGHLFYPGFVNHFITISVLKLELLSGNAQIGTNFVLISVISTFDHDLLHGHPFCHGNYSWKCHDDTMIGTLLTRPSENDNTPKPLDQWTNSPFTLIHYLADLFAKHRGPRSIPLCIQHHIQLTSLSFQVSQTSHSCATAISIFYLENPRSMSWVRSKFEVTKWV